MFLMARGAVSWSSRIQSIISLSSTEVEYIAASHATQEAYWLWELLKELGHEQVPTWLLCDNQSALALIWNLGNHPRIKYIALRYHFFQDAVANGHLKLEYCQTEEMTADLMTKSLGRVKYKQFIQKLGMVICVKGVTLRATPELWPTCPHNPSCF